jgi:outer membrane receptor protein involved in Fe transport
MSVPTFRALRRRALCGSTLAAALGFAAGAAAQTQLPEVVVTAPKEKEKPKPKPVQVLAAPRPAPAPAPAPPVPAAPPVNPVTATTNTLNKGLNTIYAPIGTISTTISHNTIQDLPGGDNQTVEKILLQAPGVTQDSAASGSLHVRNEHANVQVRINGIMLPDGVTGFGTFLDTALIGNMTLITGALPAQFGLRTSGVLDIQTRNDAFNGGTVGVYGGSRQTFTPSFEYGGQVGQTQYFLTGRFFESNIGLENPTPNWAAIHDHTTQERGFAYVSTILDPYSRYTLMAGASYGAFQIPNTPGLTPNFTAFGISNFNSALLNENQVEQTYFTVAAWQRSINGADVQLSYFNRYSSVHFTPDPIGDIIFNGVASQVFRSDFANGVTGDIAYRLNEAHTLRAGLLLRTDKTQVTNTDTLEPLDAAGNPIDAPFTVVDPSSLVGYTAGLYLQDEWRLTNSLTLNAGLRFDQYWAYITEYQFSPRISLTWKPFESTTFHIGYARTFTPPEQVLAAPTNLALFQNTTEQPSVNLDSPVRAERADVYDVGVVQQVLPGLEASIDAYYKKAKNLIDDGQFGQAFVLTAFNYAQGENVGVELSTKYKNGPFQAYGNIAVARQIAINPISNQFLFDNATPLPDLGGLTQFQYLQTHWVFTDHNQWVTASAGGTYQFCGRPARPDEWMSAADADACGIRLSADMIYGSGLRDGDANISTVPQYTQFNVGLAREFLWPLDPKPMTVRFDVINLLDTVYFIRNGSGIGVFAPQYGPQRGYFLGVSKKF